MIWAKYTIDYGLKKPPSIQKIFLKPEDTDGVMEAIPNQRKPGIKMSQ